MKIISPSLVNRHRLILHDNAWRNTGYEEILKLNEFKYDILHQLSYSPDLMPTNFHLFKHLELFLRAKEYKNED